MATRLVKRSIEIPARADGSARIAVVADTHSQPHPAIGKHLTGLAPDAILHAGDIGDLSVLDELRAYGPVYAVRGNIDTRAKDVPDVLTIDLAGAERPLRMLLVHIAVYGPKLRAEVAKLARAERASLVVCGHSHVPFIGEDRGLTMFNPGSIGPRRFHLPIVFGVIDVGRAGARLTHVNCETGERWMPPAY
ncbi:MAG: metallophosphoesterase [Kofleriaceae bacterium]